jgi:uncharacterized damage-inducible protein DinB
MSQLDFLRPLYAHMEWADALVWQRVAATSAAADDEKLRILLHHIHMVQRAFLTVWTNGPLHFDELSAFRDLASLLQWGRDTHGQLATTLDSPGDLDSELKLPWSDRLVATLGRSAAPTTLGETMLQVPMHSLYHRGQVNVRLRELGGDPPLVDFIAWLWLGKPAPEWPSLTIL